MINNNRGKMSEFPIPMGLYGLDRFDVVFVGNVVPNYYYSSLTIPGLLKDDYVFLFTTEPNGHVNINLLRHNKLSYFNHILRERGSFHVLEKKSSLIINDFLEVISEENENGIRVTAQLKKQKILGKDHKVMRVEDFRVLLIRENKDEYYANYPILELGPEFQAVIDLAETEEQYYDLINTSYMLQSIGNCNKKNSELIDSLQVVQAELNKKIDDAKLKSDQAFERCLDYKRKLPYIYKRI